MLLVGGNGVRYLSRMIFLVNIGCHREIPISMFVVKYASIRKLFFFFFFLVEHSAEKDA